MRSPRATATHLDRGDRRYNDGEFEEAILADSEAIALDITADQLQHEIEEKAILTIARRQPMAVDLREIVAALRLSNDLERIADYLLEHAPDQAQELTHCVYYARPRSSRFRTAPPGRREDTRELILVP